MKAIRTLLFALLTLLLPASTMAQLTLEECYSAARSHYPLSKQEGIIGRSLDYTLENAARGWWPSLTFSAKAQVQSDVTTMPIDPDRLAMMGIAIPQLSKDQYQANLALTQPLYDGGAIAAQKQAARAEAEANRRGLDASLYGLRSRVEQLYFGVLLIDEQLRLNDTFVALIQANIDRTEAAIRHGIAHESDCNQLRVELLKARQAAVGYRTTAKAYREMLAELTGLSINETTVLSLPSEKRAMTANFVKPGMNRPEMASYAARIAGVEAKRAGLKAGLRPRLSLFMQGGYGRPGLNMLDDDFQLYGLAGLNLSWNLSNFYTHKRKNSLLSLEQDRLRSDQETFLQNVEIEATQQRAEIQRYDDLLATDADIKALRTRIRQATEAQVTNGTASTTDLIAHLNEEQQAALSESLHRLQRLLAIYQLQTTLNQ